MNPRLRKATQVTILSAALAMGLIGASGATDEPENIVKYRQTMMKIQDAHLVEIVAVLRGEVSFRSHVARHAAAVKDISDMVGDLFPEGSVTPDSRARPEIWQQRDKFEEAIGLLKSSTAKLAEAADTGDLNAVGAALNDVGKACDNCHKQFRMKKN